MKEQIKKAGNQGSVLYGMGFIGSLVYFISHAMSLWMGIFGIIKAVLWPALVIYKVLELLKL